MAGIMTCSDHKEWRHHLKMTTGSAGVCRLLSRINHSCFPSAELVTNPELETQDLRAVRQMRQGEEITANYADLEDGLNQVGIFWG